MPEPKRIDLAEFHKFGYLQEANRQFFHPHGLALEVVVDDKTGEVRLGGVWDYRDDPEGVVFGDLPTPHLGSTGAEKAARVREDRIRHFKVRLELFGSTVDPDFPHILQGPDVEPVDWVYPKQTSR